MFHDIRLSDVAEQVPEVRQAWGTDVAADGRLVDALWEEIKHEYDATEFVHRSGVGILRV